MLIIRPVSLSGQRPCNVVEGAFLHTGLAVQAIPGADENRGGGGGRYRPLINMTGTESEARRIKDGLARVARLRITNRDVRRLFVVAVQVGKK